VKQDHTAPAESAVVTVTSATLSSPLKQGTSKEMGVLVDMDVQFHGKQFYVVAAIFAFLQHCWLTVEV